VALGCVLERAFVKSVEHLYRLAFRKRRFLQTSVRIAGRFCARALSFAKTADRYLPQYVSARIVVRFYALARVSAQNAGEYSRPSPHKEWRACTAAPPCALARGSAQSVVMSYA